MDNACNGLPSLWSDTRPVLCETSALTVTTEGEEGFWECISKLQGNVLAPFSVLESFAGLGADSSGSSAG